MERSCYGKDEGCPPQLLDLIPKDRREWVHVQRSDEHCRSHSHSSYSEDKELELRLGPPGENWTITDGNGTTNSNNSRERDDFLLSLAHFSTYHHHQTNNITTTSGAKRGFSDTTMNNNGGHSHKLSSLENSVGPTLSSPWLSQQQQQQPKKAPSFHQLPSYAPQSLPGTGKDPSQHCDSNLQNIEEEKGFSSATAAANTAVPPNISQKSKRNGPAPVVGWPPIRSFRKNIASSSSSKPSPDSQKVVRNSETGKPPVESNQKGLFVKINMDGVPIGRKVDLKAFDSYEKLSSAVDDLFRGLLAAQGDSYKQEDEKAITGLLDGTGEYTLVYEDNEGDRMLVGDVPWHMFVSTVKRLRVLKSSDLSTLHLGRSKHGKISP